MRPRKAHINPAAHRIAERLAGLTAGEVDRCCVVRYGSALMADDGAFVAFLLPSDVLVWPESAPSITATINDRLFDELLGASKISELKLGVKPNRLQVSIVSALFGRQAAPFQCSRTDFESMMSAADAVGRVENREEIADVV